MTEYLSSENLTEKAYDLSKVLSNTQSTWPSSKLNPASTKSKVVYSNHCIAVFQEQGNSHGNYKERYPGYQRFFSRAAGIFGVDRRPKPRVAKLFARVTIKT